LIGYFEGAGMRAVNRERILGWLLRIIGIFAAICIMVTLVEKYSQTKVAEISLPYLVAAQFNMWGQTTQVGPVEYTSTLFRDSVCQEFWIPSYGYPAPVCEYLPPFETYLAVFSMLLVAVVASCLVLRRKKKLGK
jgi:predicted DNA-binding transcriptional regulator